MKKSFFAFLLLSLTFQSCENTDCVKVCDQMSYALVELQNNPTVSNYETHSDLYDLYRDECVGCQTVEYEIKGNGYQFQVFHCLGCTDRKN